MPSELLPFLCFSSLGCPGRDIESFCDLAVANGIGQVEIRCLESVVDYPGLLASNTRKLEATREVLRTHQIQVAMVGASLDLIGHGPEHIPALVQACHAADALGAPLVRVFGGGHEGSSMDTALLKQAAQLYKSAVEKCREAGTKAVLVVETHGGLVTSERVLQFCNEFGQAVPILWDTHHTWKLGGESPAFTYGKIRSLVRHFHCKDSRPDPVKNDKYAYVAPGQGTFPFGEFFQTIQSGPVPGRLSLEWEKQWHPELPEVGEILPVWRELVAKA
jgi:sugar phosphate isomerase/epimerase